MIRMMQKHSLFAKWAIQNNSDGSYILKMKKKQQQQQQKNLSKQKYFAYWVSTIVFSLWYLKYEVKIWKILAGFLMLEKQILTQL